MKNGQNSIFERVNAHSNIEKTYFSEFCEYPGEFWSWLIVKMLKNYKKYEKCGKNNIFIDFVYTCICFKNAFQTGHIFSLIIS